MLLLLLLLLLLLPLALPLPLVYFVVCVVSYFTYLLLEATGRWQPAGTHEKRGREIGREGKKERAREESLFPLLNILNFKKKPTGINKCYYIKVLLLLQLLLLVSILLTWKC